MAERRKQKQQHDKKIINKYKPEEFRPKQRVALQDPSTKEWTVRGQIIEEVAPRSYNIKLTNGRILRRNRHHIRKLYSTTSNTDTAPPTLVEPDEQLTDDESIHDSQYSSDSDTIPYEHSDAEVEETVNNNNQPRITRSGRIVHDHRPLDYQDL